MFNKTLFTPEGRILSWRLHCLALRAPVRNEIPTKVFKIRVIFLLLQAQNSKNKYEQLRDGIHFKSRFV